MRNVSLIIFCALLIIVIITLVDAQQQKSKKAAVPTNKPARAASNAKVKSAQNLSKGRQAATKKPSTTIKKRRATTKKSTTKGILKAFSKSNFALTTVFDEDAPDIESGTDCYDSCFPNSTFITGAGKIRNPEQYGRFLDFGGKTYLLGKNAVDWKENWKTCCALGMTPMIFVSQDELTEFARGFEKYASNKETKYWTGGFKHELNNMWSWCTKDSPDPMDENLVTELSKEKDKSDNNCVSMSTSVGGSITLTNYLCNITMATDSNSSIYLACESIDKTPDDLLGDRSKCTTRCNATRSCKRNETLFKFNKNNEMILENRYKYGRWVSKCGRYFLFSNKTNTYDEARDRCCALGMELLSIKTAAKRKCLSKVTRDYPDTTGEFWTSGTDLDCNGGYRWCSVDRAFLKHEVLWGADEPNQKRGDCVTVRTNSNAKLTTLQTDLCPAKKRYICEVRQSGTTVETVQKECVDLFGLTNAEVEGLDNISNYTNKMKCYLKCIGDNLGMLVNGVLQEGNVMRLMEKSNEKGDMDKGYQAINECKNKSIPDDECESAYRMYKCGKEQAPVVFGKMVVYKEVTSEDNTAPVDMAEPRTCKLKMSTRCQINLRKVEVQLRA
ncbi:uncharacterized protein LOC132200398 isoform X2 [Neocloeon triangulifer]|uniref:uncharacterized protein LOC132200398 isoform X2 n=1 Tax=Neocloeon triangulifer TaxID=2078957 RepID=UPI00286F97D6|nr:uncharacterized protein LOC132200398 isoform X2 [Neocloeon triangulifer]